jgi:hypothetical protein
MDKLEMIAVRIRHCQDNSGPVRFVDDIQEILKILVDLVEEIQRIETATAKTFQDLQ